MDTLTMTQPEPTRKHSPRVSSVIGWLGLAISLARLIVSLFHDR